MEKRRKSKIQIESSIMSECVIIPSKEEDEEAVNRGGSSHASQHSSPEASICEHRMRVQSQV